MDHSPRLPITLSSAFTTIKNGLHTTLTAVSWAACTLYALTAIFKIVALLALVSAGLSLGLILADMLVIRLTCLLSDFFKALGSQKWREDFARLALVCVLFWSDLSVLPTTTYIDSTAVVGRSQRPWPLLGPSYESFRSVAERFSARYELIFLLRWFCSSRSSNTSNVLLWSYVLLVVVLDSLMSDLRSGSMRS